MDRIMALDIGDKRIGIALSDPLMIMALPFETLNRTGIKKDLEYILTVIKEKAVTEIVCGLPVNFDGSNCIQTSKTQKFIDELRRVTDIKVFTTDERMTTLSAKRVLIEADMTREKRKTVIDKVAASYILESYLKIRKNRGEN